MVDIPNGLPCDLTWIDRETGVAAGLFTQIMPPGDAAVMYLLLQLEEALYLAMRSRATRADDYSRL
ncbi:hypothetical protein BBP40_010003 [Aspergillus hancockii]|nr:hypothetical protein BBP40_010003 [Aspergillus hancockii]